MLIFNKIRTYTLDASCRYGYRYEPSARFCLPSAAHLCVCLGLQWRQRLRPAAE